VLRTFSRNAQKNDTADVLVSVAVEDYRSLKLLQNAAFCSKCGGVTPGRVGPNDLAERLAPRLESRLADLLVPNPWPSQFSALKSQNAFLSASACRGLKVHKKFLGSCTPSPTDQLVYSAHVYISGRPAGLTTGT